MATDEAMRDYLAKEVDSELVYFLSDASMDLKLQYDLTTLYKTMRAFTSMADSRNELRNMALDFGLDVSAGTAAEKAATRAKIALVISAWESAREFIKKELELKAEAKVLAINKPLSVTESSAMRRALEQSEGKIDGRRMPSSEYLSQKMQEVETGELRASPLDEIVSSYETQAEQIQTTVDAKGGLKITSVKKKGKMPTDSESYRCRLRLEAVTWMLIATKFRHKSFLVDLSLKDFEDFIDYMLGERVLRMQVPDAQGAMTDLSPSWHIFLAYDYALRKEVFEIVRDSMGVTTIKEALKSVVKDAELKGIHFTAPIALSRDHPSKYRRTEERKTKGPGKGKDAKGKGKGKKGKGKDNKGGKFAGATPDGKKICFDYNSEKGCSKNPCSYLHVCRVMGCFSSHPSHQHP